MAEDIITQTNKGVAFDYRSRGMPPVPLGPGKHPPVAWKEFQSRLPTEDEINGWGWDLGVMVVTGAISGAVALDADDAEAVAFVLAQGIPDDTPRFSTPKGMQFVFKHPGVPVKTVARFIEGVALDMKGDGGVTAVPPTPGRVWEVPLPDDLAQLPELPLWALRGLLAKNSSGDEVARADAGEPIPAGQRNQTLIRFAGAMRDWGMSQRAIFAALVQINRDSCDPPLDRDEVEQIARSAGRYSPKNPIKPNTRPDDPFGGIYSAYDLMTVKLPEPNWAVPGYVPEGLTILAGKQKIGKSWQVLAMAIAVASGGRVFGTVDVERGDVLYMALEDNPRRMQDRINTIMGGRPVPKRLNIVHTCPKLGQGCLEALELWLDSRPEARLVIIDVLARIKSNSRGNRNAYELDYSEIAPIQELAKSRGIAVVLVHHLRKGESTDPMEMVSGSLGQVGPADAVLILQRQRLKTEGSLFVMGRDIKDERELAMGFDPDTATWHILGDADQHQASEARKDILDIVRRRGQVTAKEMSDLLDSKYDTVRKTMRRMADDGQLLDTRVGNTTVYGLGQTQLSQLSQLSQWDSDVA